MLGIQSTSMFPRTAKNSVRVLLAALLLAFISLTPNQASAQSEEDPNALKPRSVTMTTEDGLPLAATYWPSRLKSEGGMVVLLHDLNGKQQDWGVQLPQALQDQGHAVLTVDLRGHGQSKGKAAGGNETVDPKAKGKTKPKSSKTAVEATTFRAVDYKLMVANDMRAVKQFIFQEHQKKLLNMNKTAIVGAGLGATIALHFAEYDWLKPPYNDGPVGNQTPRGQDIRALVLLTPDSDVSGLPLPDTIKVLRAPLFQVAILFAVGDKDRLDKGQTKKLYEQAITMEQNKERMYLDEFKSTARGIGLFGKNPQVEQHILKFMEDHLSKLNSEWRDRESRVGKKATAK